MTISAPVLAIIALNSARTSSFDVVCWYPSDQYPRADTRSFGGGRVKLLRLEPAGEPSNATAIIRRSVLLDGREVLQERRRARLVGRHRSFCRFRSAYRRQLLVAPRHPNLRSSNFSGQPLYRALHARLHYC